MKRGCTAYSSLGSLLVAATLLAGCALFEDLDLEDEQKDPIFRACEDYCRAVVYAWDDCLDLWYTCGITNEEQSNAACTQMCVDAASDFDDEEVDAAIECIECYLEVYGETPSCWDVYLSDVTPCVDDCENVDTSGLDEDWTEVVEDDCPEDV